MEKDGVEVESEIEWEQNAPAGLFKVNGSDGAMYGAIAV
jgi:hypothetical protein